MQIEVKPGKYIVAVSGGVDSMVLLHLLTGQPQLKLVVAHFDHGIRKDSKIDQLLVQRTAQTYELEFSSEKGNLGAKTSEDTARQARYKFLNKVKSDFKAQAIITAHHQDDLLETAVINMLRGTNRRGLSSLKSTPELVRPLLNIPKKELMAYAKSHKIAWHEDSTNLDTVYLRNYVRLKILPRLSKSQRQTLVGHINKLGKLNKSIDEILNQQIAKHKQLDRQWFILLPHALAKETMHTWLINNQVRDLDKKRLELLVRAAKTLAPGKQADVNKSLVLKINSEELALVHHER